MDNFLTLHSSTSHVENLFISNTPLWINYCCGSKEISLFHIKFLYYNNYYIIYICIYKYLSFYYPLSYTLHIALLPSAFHFDVFSQYTNDIAKILYRSIDKELILLLGIGLLFIRNSIEYS